jgi:hypothetical protein
LPHNQALTLAVGGPTAERQRHGLAPVIGKEMSKQQLTLRSGHRKPHAHHFAFLDSRSSQLLTKAK